MPIIGYKNPLAVALGIVFKRARNITSRSSTEIANEIGIKPSFYRLIESGANHLHVSKALSVVDAFEGNLSFDGIIKILGCISIMEVYGKNAEKAGVHYSDGLADAIEKFVEYDDQRLKLLFSKWDGKFFQNFKTSNFDSKNWIKDTSLPETLESFLRNYETFGQDVESIQQDYLAHFFDDVPSLYVDYLTRMKEELLTLPVKLFFSDISKWEKKSMDDLIELHAVVKNPYGVIHFENLKNYQYKYLWGKKFRCAKFIFTHTDMTPKEIKKEFSKNLKKSYIKSNGEIPVDFEEKLNKIDFEVTDYIQVEKVLGTHDAWWAFTISNNHSFNNIGYLANVKVHPSIKSYEIFEDGFCQTHQDTFNNIKNFKKAWSKVAGER